jgi:hypothetical protein
MLERMLLKALMPYYTHSIIPCLFDLEDTPKATNIDNASLTYAGSARSLAFWFFFPVVEPRAG